MDDWVVDKWARTLATAFTTIVVIVAFLFEDMQLPRLSSCPQPSMFRDLTRWHHMNRILRSGCDYCVSYLSMDVGLFMHLSSMMSDKHLLMDTRHVLVEEQLVIFFHIVGHNTKNRIMRIEFVQSGETISWYFNNVLWALCAIRDDFVQAPGTCHPEIENHPSWNPYFKVNMQNLKLNIYIYIY